MDALNLPPGFRETSIHGVILQDLKEIATEGGPVLHMLRADNPLYKGFGEIYFSEVLPGAVKAWKRHRRQNQHFAVPRGLMDIVVYDARSDSPTKGMLTQFRLGRPDHYQLLRIPHGLWYGFTCVSEEAALLANCADIPHSPDESEKLPADSSQIPYQWR